MRIYSGIVAQQKKGMTTGAAMPVSVLFYGLS